MTEHLARNNPPPVFIRSRLALEVAAELAGMADWPYRRAHVHLRARDFDDEGFKIFGTGSPDGIDLVGSGEVGMAMINPSAMLTMAYRGTGPYANLEEDVIPVWKKNLAEVAKCPNVVVKLGGIGQPRTGYDWSSRDKPIGSEELAGLMAPFINYAIEQFGPERGMIESNFPPDKVGHSYNILYNAFKRLTKDYSTSERDAMFRGTAERVYRVEY